jgi:hypothetical protein
MFHHDNVWPHVARICTQLAQVRWSRRGWLPFHGLLTKRAILLVFFSFFVTYFVHNVAATVYDQKELLEIRTAISHFELDK